jgi:hypothetical protein
MHGNMNVNFCPYPPSQILPIDIPSPSASGNKRINCTTHKFHPLDVSVLKPPRRYNIEEIKEWLCARSSVYLSVGFI